MSLDTFIRFGEYAPKTKAKHIDTFTQMYMLLSVPIGIIDQIIDQSIPFKQILMEMIREVRYPDPFEEMCDLLITYPIDWKTIECLSKRNYAHNPSFIKWYTKLQDENIILYKQIGHMASIFHGTSERCNRYVCKPVCTICPKSSIALTKCTYNDCISCIIIAPDV
jgi:hypothetical protein